MKNWVEGAVVAKKEWGEGLYSLQIDAAVEPFRAGQFVQIAMDIDGQRVGRSYSLVNAPDQRPLEIFFNEVPDGPLTPRLSDLQPGQAVWVTDKASGVFTLDKVPECQELWLFATGTALGVYLAILKTDTPWQRFERVILVHGTRGRAEQAYLDEIAAFGDRHGDKFQFVPVLSREQAAGCLSGRVTNLFADGTLERHVGSEVHHERSHVMLCGNSAMISEMRGLLEARGLQRNTIRGNGQYTTEQYH